MRMWRPSRPAAAALPATIVTPSGDSLAAELRELWRFRELLAFFVWRDVTVRYRQTVVGLAWVVVQPLATMVVFTLFFGTLARLPSDGVPHPVFYYSGLLPWMYFAAALQSATGAMVEHQRIITRVYFPRVMLPLAAVLPGLLDAAVGHLMLLILMVVYGVPLSPRLLLAPVVMSYAAVVALAAGLWLSALNARYRDVRYVVPFAIQLWMFVSPVAYPSTLVPASWRWAYGLNPMAGAIDAFRWTVTGAGRPALAPLAAGAAATALLLVGGLAFFRRVEGTIADVV